METTSTLERALEEEVMDTEAEARAYDAMDHGAVNARFVADFLAIEPDASRTLDVGTGTARIPLELVRRAPAARVTAVDLAAHMLAVARENVEKAGLTGQITLARADGKRLAFADASFSSVVSNSIVHHIPEPRVALGDWARVVEPSGWLFVRDLARPVDEAEVRSLVATYAAHDTPEQRALFEASLRAALTVAEVRAIVDGLGLGGARVELTSDRHWTLRWRRP